MYGIEFPEQETFSLSPREVAQCAVRDYYEENGRVRSLDDYDEICEGIAWKIWHDMGRGPFDHVADWLWSELQ